MSALLDSGAALLDFGVVLGALPDDGAVLGTSLDSRAEPYEAEFRATNMSSPKSPFQAFI